MPSGFRKRAFYLSFLLSLVCSVFSISAAASSSAGASSIEVLLPRLAAEADLLGLAPLHSNANDASDFDEVRADASLSRVLTFKVLRGAPTLKAGTSRMTLREGIWIIDGVTEEGTRFLLGLGGLTLSEAKRFELSSLLSKSCEWRFASWGWLEQEAEAQTLPCKPAAAESGVLHYLDLFTSIRQSIFSQQAVETEAKVDYACISTAIQAGGEGVGQGILSVGQWIRHFPSKTRALWETLKHIRQKLNDSVAALESEFDGFSKLPDDARRMFECQVAGMMIFPPMSVLELLKSERFAVLIRDFMRKFPMLKPRYEWVNGTLRYYVKTEADFREHMAIHVQNVNRIGTYVYDRYKAYYPHLHRDLAMEILRIHDKTKLAFNDILSSLYKGYGKNPATMAPEEAKAFLKAKERLNAQDEAYFKDAVRKFHAEGTPEEAEARRFEHVADFLDRENPVAAEEMGREKNKPAEAFLDNPDDQRIAREVRTWLPDILKGKTYWELKGLKAPRPPVPERLLKP